MRELAKRIEAVVVRVQEVVEGRDAWKRAARFIARRGRQYRARADAAEKRVAELTAENARLQSAVDQALVEHSRLYACAEEQGEADCGNGLVIVRKADLTALRSRQTGVDAETVRLIHELLDRLLVTGSEVKA